MMDDARYSSEVINEFDYKIQTLKKQFAQLVCSSSYKSAMMKAQIDDSYKEIDELELKEKNLVAKHEREKNELVDKNEKEMTKLMEESVHEKEKLLA